MKLVKSPSNYKVKIVGGSQRCHYSGSTQDTLKGQKNVKWVTDVSIPSLFVGSSVISKPKVIDVIYGRPLIVIGEGGESQKVME